MVKRAGFNSGGSAEICSWGLIGKLSSYNKAIIMSKIQLKYIKSKGYLFKYLIFKETWLVETECIPTRSILFEQISLNSTFYFVLM